MSAIAGAQQIGVGANINVVGGPATVNPVTKVPSMGDPYLQRQNEPSAACSSRNPLNCLLGANDYRTVNVPGLADGKVTGDASLGVFWTRDGGLTWRSWLLPGYPQDTSPEGLASPAHAYGAMADPTVRAGTNGLFYYTGIAFNRSAVSSNSAGAEGKDGVLFTALYIDDNNTQQVDTPFRHVRQSAIAYSNGAKFLDKPTMAVDIPRQGSATCTIPGTADGKIPAQSFPGGNVYVVYSAFMGQTDHEHTKIMFARSTDCGKTWNNGLKLSESFRINQSASIGISPASGQVQVAWREFSSNTNSDQIVVAVSDDLGQSFKKAVVATTLNMAGASTAFDQPSLPSTLAPDYRMFRTNSYPAVCAAASGEAYLLWAERGRGPNLESRIMYSRSSDGLVWTTPAAVDNTSAAGYQFMPAVSCAGNKVTALWYDQRDDAALPITIPLFGVGTWIADALALTIPARTLDVRSAQLTSDAATPAFEPSVKVSRYPVGIFNVGSELVAYQLQYNLENLPLFGGAKMPFIGDYIDVIPATTFLPLAANGGQSGVTANGVTQKNNKRAARAAEAVAPNGWEFNTTAAGTPVFHAFWTDNRNVVPGAGGTADPFATPACSPGTQAGSKNQDVYTARLTRGIAAGVFGNARTQAIDPNQPLLTQRAYSVYVQNLTAAKKTVTLQIATILAAPEKASFRQFDAGESKTQQVDIGPYSGIARTVYVRTASPKSVRVDVDEIPIAPATTGDATFVIINPDPTNPAPADPAVASFDETHGATLGTPEVTNFSLNDLNVTATNLGALDASNPTFLNPTFLNPTFLNPTFLNPTFLNPNFLNPNFLNPNFLNPNFLNPTFLNPNFLNPTFLNPTFLNGAPDPTLTTMTWETEASANTSSSYFFRALSTEPLDPAWQVQLLIYRLYFAPAPQGGGNCGVEPTVQHELISSVLNPSFLNAATLNLDAANPNFLNGTAESGDVANASYALNAGDKALITLQILTPDGALTVEEARQTISGIVVPTAVDSTDAQAGSTTPTVSLTITTPTLLPRGVSGAPYSFQLNAVGGSGNYTWTYFPGPVIDHPPPPPGVIYVDPCTVLPGSLQLSAAGLISGTPSSTEIPQIQGGVCVVEVHVTDASNPPQTAVGFFTVDITNPLAIVTQTLPTAVAGSPYNVTLASSGGRSPLVWSLQTGTLPAGLTLTSAGQLQGTTTATGVYALVIAVTDFASLATAAQTATQAFDLQVVQPPPATLTFVQQPSDAFAGINIVPPVVVKVLDASGAAVPGAQVTMSLSSNPGDTSLSGTTTAISDQTGNATFADLSLGTNAAGYALTAATGPLSAVSNSFNIGSISFEMFPDGTPACNGCGTTNQFASRGVVFSFSDAVDPSQTNVLLLDSTGVDPVNGDGLRNHSIRNPGDLTTGFTGTMRMDLANNPSFVNFRVRGPSLGGQFTPFQVTAFDPSGAPIPANQITRTGGLYTPSAACCGQYSEETISINSLIGIGSVTIGTGPRNIFLDNLRLVGGPIGNDEEQPAVVVPPPTKGAQR